MGPRTKERRGIEHIDSKRTRARSLRPSWSEQRLIVALILAIILPGLAFTVYRNGFPYLFEHWGLMVAASFLLTLVLYVIPLGAYVVMNVRFHGWLGNQEYLVVTRGEFVGPFRIATSYALGSFGHRGLVLLRPGLVQIEMGIDLGRDTYFGAILKKNQRGELSILLSRLENRAERRELPLSVAERPSGTITWLENLADAGAVVTIGRSKVGVGLPMFVWKKISPDRGPEAIGDLLAALSIVSSTIEKARVWIEALDVDAGTKPPA